MTRAYWDAVAQDYERQVLSVFDHDTTGAIAGRIVKLAPGKRAADMGCGVGKFTPLLAGKFAEVEACDFSPEALKLAREACSDSPNVRFHRFDFALEAAPFSPVEFVLCVNVLIMSSLDARMRAWRLVTNQVSRGGQLLLVVPAHESLLYQSYLAVAEGVDRGLACESAIVDAVSDEGSIRDALLGVHDLEGVSTKHYLREELRALLDEHHFETVELLKLEYPQVNDTLGRPGLWDWLAVGRRR